MSEHKISSSISTVNLYCYIYVQNANPVYFSLWNSKGDPKWSVKVIQSGQSTKHFLIFVCSSSEAAPGMEAPAYNAQSQGALEKLYQTFKSRCTAFVEWNPDWEEELPWLLLAAREVVQESTRFSLDERVFGHTMYGLLTLLHDPVWDNGSMSTLQPDNKWNKMMKCFCWHAYKSIIKNIFSADWLSLFNSLIILLDKDSKWTLSCYFCKTTVSKVKSQLSHLEDGSINLGAPSPFDFSCGTDKRFWSMHGQDQDDNGWGISEI